MKHLLLAAGAATLALGLPATAALADGYNARPAYMQPKPKPKAKPAPRAHAKPAAKPQKQARHKPRVHKPKAYGYAAAHVRYEELETIETSVTHEVNGHVSGPYVSYSERYIAPHRGCHPQAPCGYSSGTPHGHGAHRGGYGVQHGSHHGHYSYPGAYHGSSYGHGAAAVVHPGFHHGALTGGVGYGVDGGPVFGASTVIVRPGGYGQGFAVRGHASSSASSYSSSQAYGGASVGYGSHGQGFGYGPSYGRGGHGYLGFKPGAYGQGIGTTGYGGCCR